MRLDKLLAQVKLGSRSQVKKMIKDKMVLVNAQVITDPKYQIDFKNDNVQVNGNTVNYREFTYIMLNKPTGYVSATTDVKEATVLDLLPKKYEDLFPVGRLDKDTVGLLLLTNDGQLAHRLLSPKKHVDKTYEVHVDGIFTNDDVKAFEQGIVLEDGYKCLSADLKIINDQQAYVTIREGKFHQIKRMMKMRNKKVVHLKRLAMGGIQLDRTLKLGQYRELTGDEISQLQVVN